MSIKEITFGDDPNEEVEGVEMKANTTSSVKSEGGSEHVWVNEKRNPLSLPIVCRVPQKIVVLMRSIEKIMLDTGIGSLEFGAFLHGEFNSSGILMIGEDFYVPAQKVSGATIDFDEEPPESKYNGCIHRHPTGCKGFSGTDANHINKNFEFSLLYEGNEIIKGIFNLEVNGVRIQLPLQIEIMYPIYNVDAAQIMSKIHKKEYPSSTTGGGQQLEFGTRHDVRNFLNAPEQEDIQDDIDKLYSCNKCGHVQFIDSFPEDCEGCDTHLHLEDVKEINDLSDTESVSRPRVINDDEEMDECDIRSRILKEHDERNGWGSRTGPFQL